MDRPGLLVVDDHEHILKQLSWAFREDFQVHTALTKEQALLVAKTIKQTASRLARPKQGG